MCGPVLCSTLAAFLVQAVTPAESPASGVERSGGDSPAPPALPSSPPAAPVDSAGDRPLHWYGAAIVAADAATVGLIYATSAYADSYQRAHSTGWSGASPLYSVLGAAYVFDGAVVHGLNHQPRRSVESIFLRLGAVAAGFGTAVAVISTEQCFQSKAEANGGFASGGGSSTPAVCYLGLASLVAFPLAAMAIDDAYLARGPVVESPAPRASVAPSLVVKPGLALLGLNASF